MGRGCRTRETWLAIIPSPVRPAGGVVFFNCNVPHCTKANTSEQPRAAVAYHFVASSVAPEVRQFPLPDGADYTEVPVVVGKSTNKELALARREQWENLVLCDEKKHKNS